MWLHLVFYIYVGETIVTEILIVNNVTQGVYVSGMTKRSDVVYVKFKLKNIHYTFYVLLGMTAAEK